MSTPSMPSILTEFAEACLGHFGPDAAGCTTDGAFIAIGDRIIHVNLDVAAGRAVVWTELPRPDYSDSACLAQAALAYTGCEMPANGLVLGISRRADLIVLGRSVEQEALLLDEGLKLVDAIAAAAPAAVETLARAAAR